MQGCLYVPALVTFQSIFVADNLTDTVDNTFAETLIV